MALLKSKVKSFLTGLQKDKVRDDSQINKDDIHQMQPTDLPRCRDDPKKTEEIIQEIKDYYFEEGCIDCSQRELESLGPEINMTSLEERIFSLKTRDTAVYRKIYDLVFSNYTAYVQELENVTMLQVSLQDAARTCVNARRSLKSARQGVSHGGLGLLGKHRKRERLHSLLDILKTLKTLQRTDTRLKVLLEVNYMLQFL
ncbi:Syndetin [Geodia barretti]|uniref:Syndetin n=3 Tax=Geodia barretti TaxID=519541 RepID=A0AA35S9I4_GEOBA|nr:Syndetin [Geodia barretti]